MNLYIRFLLLLAKRLFVRNPSSMFSPCTTPFRVNPLDLDLNFHMNNGRYLTIMDLGRFDLMLKAKVFWKILMQGYYPVVSSESIRFKKSLGPFQSFDLVTTIESWDEKDFYISQKFMSKGRVYAEGYIKGRFKQRGKKGSVSTEKLFGLMGEEYPGPKMSELGQQQLRIEGLLVKEDL